ncbi:MAG TPA: ThiF family adenylyltransferase [Longimicrobium sp.]|jgi:molybdopterin/thiamine biosynthesis adenylyltransferase
MIARSRPDDPAPGPVRLRIPRALFEAIKGDLAAPHAHAGERVGFISVGTKRLERGEWLICAQEYHPLADGRYIVDSKVGARIDGEAIREAMQRVLDTGRGGFHVHLHEHRGVPAFSRTDRAHQPRLVDALANVDARVPHGMLVLSEDAAHAWVRLPGAPELVAPALVSIVGDPLTLIWPEGAPGVREDQFARQDFLGVRAQDILARARIGVVGMGGGGSHMVQQLLHVGALHLRVFDHDRVERSNLNRLIGATVWDVEEETRKIGIARRLATGLLPEHQMEARASAWQENVDLLAGCDLVLGAVDTFAARRDLEAFCRRYLIPYVDIGMDVHSVAGESPRMAGQVIVSLPGDRCMHCIDYLNDDRLAREAALYGAAGGRPQVVWPNGVLASTAVGIAVDLLTGWSGVVDRALFLSYDGNRGMLGPHPRWPYIGHGACEHFPLHQVGDPQFRAVVRVGAHPTSV